MIAKVGQMAPIKVDKKSNNDSQETQEKQSFSTVLKNASEESNKMEKTKKQESDKAEKVSEQDSEKQIAEESITKDVNGENIVTESQPVQTDVVQQLESSKKVEVQPISTLNENIQEVVAVDIKVGTLENQETLVSEGVSANSQEQEVVVNQLQETVKNAPIKTENQTQETSVGFENVPKKVEIESEQKVVKSAADLKVEDDSNSEIKINSKSLNDNNKFAKNVKTTSEKTSTNVKENLSKPKVEKPNEDFKVSTETPVSLTKVDNQSLTQLVEKVAPKADVQTKEVLSQVLKQIDTNLKSNNKEFTFNLHPKDLGKIAVKMAIKEGLLIVDIVASSAKTQSILATNSNQIRTILESQLSQQQSQFVDASQNFESSDYLQKHSQNQNANHGNQNQENNQSKQDSNETSTEDFLSVMKMVSQFKI